jgi:hypothetical protein
MASNFEGWEGVAAKMGALGTRVRGNAKTLVTVAAGRTVNEAKRTAPWTDRSGDARRSIHAEVTEDAGGITAAIGIGVDYGKYLEMAHGGKYRVIDPTVFGFGKQEMQNVMKDLLNG